MTLSPAAQAINTALAQPEPTGLPPGYIDPEHTGADRHLLQVFYRACQSEGGTADEINLRGIRAVLADAALAQPESKLTQAEILDLADDYGFDEQEITGWDGKEVIKDHGWECTDSQLVAFARAVRAWGQPAIEPVPVAERLPGEGDCDAEGRCWWFMSAHSVGIFRQSSSWCLGKRVAEDFGIWTHWLPHYALPVPANTTPEAQ